MQNQNGLLPVEVLVFALNLSLKGWRGEGEGGNSLSMKT
jgi:hypothetical protein